MSNHGTLERGPLDTYRLRFERHYLYAKQFGPSDFPAFVSATGIAIHDAMHTPGLDGYAFSGHGDMHVELLRARGDAEMPERPAAQ